MIMYAFSLREDVPTINDYISSRRDVLNPTEAFDQQIYQNFFQIIVL